MGSYYGRNGELVMKKIIVLLIFILLFISCKAGNERQDTELLTSEKQDENITHKAIQHENKTELGMETLNEGLVNNQLNFGLKLSKIIDVQIADPEIRGIVRFVDDDKIIVSADPDVSDTPVDKSFYLYDLKNGAIMDFFRVYTDSSGFKSGIKGKTMYYALEMEKDVYSTFEYSFETKESITIEQETYFKNSVRPRFEDFGSLRGSMDYKWGGYSLNLWRVLRDGQGIPESYAGDEYTIGLFHEKNLITTFPYLRVVTFGQFRQSPGGKYLALEAGFYRKDILGNNSPDSSFMPSSLDAYSGAKYDTYQYGVFIYEAVTEENVEILDDQSIQVLTFPNPNEAASGIKEVKSRIIDGSNLNVSPGEVVFWGTGIRVKDGTALYRYPDLGSEVIKVVTNEGRIQIIVDRSSDEETINNQTAYWYYVEDQTGERGWVFGKENFELIQEPPYFFK